MKKRMCNIFKTTIKFPIILNYKFEKLHFLILLFFDQTTKTGKQLYKSKEHQQWSKINRKLCLITLLLEFLGIQVTGATTRGVLCKIAFLEISQNSQENTCVRVSFLTKLQASGLQLYFKNRLWHTCFPVNFAKFFRTLFL